MRSLYLFVSCLLLLPNLAEAGGPAGYRVGVGRADITPKEPIWMAGYGNRNKPSIGVDHPLSTKALAIQSGDEPPLLLITADIIGFDRTTAEEIAAEVQKRLGVPRERVLINASHTHAGPVIGRNLKGMFELSKENVDVIGRYTEMLVERVLSAAEMAMKSREPASITFGRSKATFAINRRVFRANGVQFGSNPDGPVDHEVDVLRIDDPQGKTRAIVFGYACHCTTLGGDYYRINGDWATYAQDFLERAHPGATALFVTGCGGDANPEPRGKLEYSPEHGLEMAGVVSRVLRSPRTPVTGKLQAVFDRVDLPLAPLPSAEDYKKKLEDKNVFVRRHAARQLAILEKGEKLPTSYPCPVQVWRIGDGLTLVALGGEVVVDYALRLKRELKGDVWVAAYSNDVFAYVPSTRILLEGGYEADFNLIYYGLPTRFRNDVEDVLTKKVGQLAQQVK
jgi:hypothetical protein